MSAPAGYKTTEVGVIPDDWEVEPLGALIGSLDAGVSVRSVSDGLSSFGHDQMVLKTSCISKGRFIPAEAKLILPADLWRAKTPAKSGSILISRMNTPDLVGEVGFVPDDWPNLFLPDRLWMMLPATGRKTDMRWLTALLAHGSPAQTLRDGATGTSGSMKNISKPALRGVLIPSPKPTEQSAIAEALSDADEAIAAVEALIAKERALKTATMQALLSGTRRLPGFSKEWERHTFGQLFQFLRNGSSARAALSASGAIGYIHYGDIHAAARPHMDCSKGALPRIAREVVNRLPRVQNGDLLIADASEDYEGTGKSVEATSIGDDEVVAGLHTLLLRPVNKMAPGFAGYLQFIPEVRRQYIAAAQGVSVYGLSRSAVKAVEVVIPRYDEQEAISSCLIEMEIDLSHQTDKLNKLRRLKTGMMQQLLTGKIRLT